jgi:hypothetical protein
MEEKREKKKKLEFLTLHVSLMLEFYKRISTRASFLIVDNDDLVTMRSRGTATGSFQNIATFFTGPNCSNSLRSLLSVVS